MVVRRPFTLAVAAGTLVVASIGGSVAFAQQSDDTAEVGTDDPALLARLDALEVDLPGEPAPTAVDLTQEGDEGDRTWGTFDGDVTGAAATLETLSPDLLRLYVDADAGQGEVADAVAQVARGWLDLGEGYEQLAAWEAHDLAFPIDADDDEGAATDADELRGAAETGLRLVLGAQQRHLAGYVALRDFATAEPEAQTRFDARADAAEAFDRDVRPSVHRLVSLETTQTLVPVERFETDAPGVDARARSMTVTCVDRRDYRVATGAEVETDTVQPLPADPVEEVEVAGAVDVLGLPLVGLPAQDERVDCPDLVPGSVAEPE